MTVRWKLTAVLAIPYLLLWRLGPFIDFEIIAMVVISYWATRNLTPTPEKG